MPKTRDTVLLSGRTVDELRRELGFLLQRVVDRLDSLEGVRGGVNLGGETVNIGQDEAGKTRLVGLSSFSSAPGAVLPAGQWEMTVYDDGSNPVLRVRYNDAGTTKVADVALL